MSISPALIRLERVRATLAGHRALDGVDWEFSSGTHWAVAGTNGSGKTTFLRIVRGDLWPDQHLGGRRVYNFQGKEQLTPIGLRQSIGYVSAELQDRYLRHEWNIPVETVVLTGFQDTPLLYAKPDSGHIQRCGELLEQLGITHLREKRFLSLSQGEARKVLIARAMAPLTARPSLLLLDEVCEGLDQASRRDLLNTVDTLAATGVQILFSTHRPDELPRCLNHGIVFHGGVVVSQGPLEQVDFSSCRVQDTPQIESPLPERLRTAAPATAPGPVVDIRQADVYLQGKQVLKDINWTIEQGEQWAVLGSNGAGKSTLLKLLRGEIHPALGGEVYRFGKLPGVELRLIRRHLGHVSSGFQAEYAAQWGRTLSAGDLVLSGFFDSIGLYDEATPDQRRIAREWMEFWGVDSLAQRKLDELSYGQLRRLLLARALAPGPDLLLLDEPCAGLDPQSRDGLLATLSRLVQGGQQIVHVTHYPEELIEETTHVLELDRGGITHCGPKQAHPLFREKP